ncbi:unnamed protein product (macronuclear) [Paramecium tetraurelia]|uniref:Uncharacterized protein n=1 Tax=Paramecium tetraurelia TaxID=5888 RepID=A0CZX1_PARTE|nr:uncharacterized protein GSPATT00011911001 [Paramecium tetraurelia]CAK76338.1 unnamed protein product [Paramecium tetraurelia]|eukprot:XP_001443735.1 hypothetical protein (macronuclear) [Paramecium tetraurelia strain d4-2]
MQQQQSNQEIAQTERQCYVKLPSIAQCRQSIKSIMSEAELISKSSVNNNTRCVNAKGERILRKELKIHSSIIEFKQNFKNMITNSKYGLQYMKRKVFPKLQPL